MALSSIPGDAIRLDLPEDLPPVWTQVPIESWNVPEQAGPSQQGRSQDRGGSSLSHG